MDTPPQATRHPATRQPVSLEQLPVTELAGAGPKTASHLARLNIQRIWDLLVHLPLRYQDRTRTTPIAQVRPSHYSVISGTIQEARTEPSRRGASLWLQLADDTGAIGLRFYRFSPRLQASMQPGSQIRCYGEARPGRSGLEFYHPETEPVDAAEPAPLATHLTAIYSTTEPLSQHRLQKLMAQCLDRLRQQPIAEWLPTALRQKYQLMEINQALNDIHHPPVNEASGGPDARVNRARKRLAFEELIAHHLGFLRQRQQVRQQAAPVLPPTPQLNDRLLATLPFDLTQAQQRVSAAISEDLDQPRPMLRLVQGDVGSGKTLVAALAALQAIGNGGQVALMAPTELLAEQHFLNFRHWFEALDFSVILLNSTIKGRERQAQLTRIANGSVAMIVGTHALFQEQVQFRRLVLVIVDEQHRFGVHQRLALKEKGTRDHQLPHQLIMTATPIPRTLAMTAYADLDYSVIDELPPGRMPIDTILIEDTRRDTVIERVGHACAEGRQCYWVCTLIDESEALQCRAAETSATELQQALPHLRIGLVHGRQKAAEKAGVMQAFASGNLDLLVATTVIEVGVDVPNASLMIIENPERLGLAQLHQLRGRVGRGSVKSYCVLMYGRNPGQTARSRLQVLRESQDGFVIAEEDLKIRGPGEVLGTRQTGAIGFRVADLHEDAELIENARAAAQELLANSSTGAANAPQAITSRWINQGEDYALV